MQITLSKEPFECLRYALISSFGANHNDNTFSLFFCNQGPLHDSLVDAIESYKLISRNSPYSKRIFSHKVLKR